MKGVNLTSESRADCIRQIGTYVLKEDLHLATPPPHPSEAPIINPNPLATSPQPATAGSKVSLVGLESRPVPFFYKGPSATTLSLAGAPSSIQEHPNESRYSTEGGISSEDGQATSASDAPATSVTLGSAPAFGEGNSLLVPTPTKDGSRRRKPKNNVTKSNSSFISRVIVNDNLSRKLIDRQSDGLFAFANINRAFQWLDMSSPTKVDINLVSAITSSMLLIPVTARLLDQDFIYQGPLSLS